jgi:hypothetical protein
VLPVRYELNLLCYVEESIPPLWSSAQSSLLQFQRSGLIPGAIRFSEK